MPQYKTGTVQVTNGSQYVVANLSSMDWSGIANGAQFMVVGDDVSYYVAGKSQVTVSSVLYWRLQLTANYAGTTNTTAAYSITQDFSPVLGIPLMRTGDINTTTLFTRAILMIESLIQSLPSWTAPTLLNGWTNRIEDTPIANLVGFYRSSGGIVRLRGLIRSGTTTFGTTIFVLPTGFRPTANIILPVASGGGSGSFYSEIGIGPDGTVYARIVGALYLSLEGISFHI